MRRIVLLALVGLAPLAAGSLARGPLAAESPEIAPVLSPRLARALDDPASPWRSEDGRYTVWVYFQDKRLAGAALDAALAAAERHLSPRAAQRRAKMARARVGAAEQLHGGAVEARGLSALVTAADLPVAPDNLAAALGTGARAREVSRWLNAASFAATPAQIEDLATLSGVRRIDLVARLRRSPLSRPLEAARRRSVPTPGGAPSPATIDSTLYGGSLAALAQINVLAAHAEGYTGANTLVGMLDTGFKTTHEAMVNIDVVARYDFINDDFVVENEPGDPPYQHSHGTITLSALMGYHEGDLVGPAFGAQVLLAKTEDTADEQPIEEDYWVAGIEWLDTFGVDVVSSSLGYSDWYTFADMDGETAVTTIAGDLAAARGIVVCNSAGNERSSTWGHIIAPADGDSVIAIGAVNLADDIAAFSSPGPTADGRIKPDVCALGVNVFVARVTADDGYSTASGTSLSCPLAAGVAALVLDRAPGLTPMQVREAMRMTASRALAPDNDFGWGVLDAHAAVHYFGPVISHAPLADSENPGGPYAVGCRITDRLPLDPGQLFARYRVTRGATTGLWLSAPLTASGMDSFVALIPGQPGGTDIAYYLTAADAQGISARFPAAGELAPLVFRVRDPGLTEVEAPASPRTALLGAVPNPFNPRTEIRFTLASAGMARLTIHDARGRLVRQLLAEALPSGEHAVAWQGRDEEGRLVGSGVYFCRLIAGGAAYTQPLIVMK